MSAVASFARTLRILWAAIGVGGTLVMVVLGALAVSGEPPNPDLADAAFYGVALLAVVATGGAFALLRLMEGRLVQASSEAEAKGAIQSLGLAALALAEMPAIAAGVAAFLTGEVLVLALGATLYGVLLLTWPSDDRVGFWLALGGRD